MTMSDLDAVALAHFFDELRVRPGHEIRDLERLSGGASRETFRCTLVVPAPDVATDDLIVQRARPGALPLAGGMVGEGRLLTAAAARGVPVPEVVAACDDPAVLGASFIVSRRLPGESIAPRLLRDQEYADARPRLVPQAAAALAAVHAIDPAAVPHLRDDDPLRQLRVLLDGLDVARPAFELALRWLAEHRPAPVPARVVHGDFRLGNLLVDHDGLRAVLDWELAHLGDPLEDLGWFCVRAWRFGHRPPVAGLAERDVLYGAYEAARGTAVDRAAAHWWEVLGTLRWGVICALQTAAHLSGASRSVELAAIGRRVCETEYDLLLLLGTAPVTVDELADRLGPLTWPSGPHPAPDAVELLAAVEEFLAGPVLTGTEGRLRFHARVAANVVAMVRRELGASQVVSARHASRLAALGLHDDRGLAARIRSAGAGVEERGAVESGVLDALAVANPGYVGER